MNVKCQFQNKQFNTGVCGECLSWHETVFELEMNVRSEDTSSSLHSDRQDLCMNPSTC